MTWDTCFGRDAFGGDDVAAPYATDLSPAPNAAITTNGTIHFRVLDDTGLAMVSVYINGEPVYDGDFLGPFRGLSQVEEHYPFVGGVQRHALDFAVKRAGGWSTPLITIDLVARDTKPNEGVVIL